MSSLSLSAPAESSLRGANARATPTPADLVITPRDRRFIRDADPSRWWCH
ncbi:MAG: hypothetical protein ACKOUM_08540 [Sphingopyxis sp.]